MTGHDGELFEIDHLRRELAVGDSVNVRCIWGDERGALSKIYRDHGEAMCIVDLPGGGFVVVRAGAVTRAA
ncbi:hypothetical protein GCM10028801_30320 [Nocardioides maradonensis]